MCEAMNELVITAQEAIEERLDEIETERKQLEQVLRSLRGQRSDPTRTSAGNSAAGRGPSRGRSSKRRRGTSAKTRSAVTEYLQAHPLADTAEVVRALGLEDGRVVGAQRRKLSQPQSSS